MADKQSREVIGGERRCGKTTELIKRASEDNLYILCANRTMAKLIFEQAKDMKLDIPHPITIEDLPLRSPYVDKVLIDEVEMILQQLIGRPVESMSTSYVMREMHPINNREPNGLEPLLTIELQNESSVPKVIYKGVEIKFKANVSFDWETSDAYSRGGLSYAIEHFERQEGQVTSNRIERRINDHAR